MASMLNRGFSPFQTETVFALIGARIDKLAAVVMGINVVQCRHFQNLWAIDLVAFLAPVNGAV